VDEMRGVLWFFERIGEFNPAGGRYTADQTGGDVRRRE
jgi:hypothetical protein